MAAGGSCGDLDEEKREKEQQAVDLKRKALTDELDDLKAKRARIEADICALEKYAGKAEATHKLTFITASNRTAKEKKASLLEIEKQIDDKLSEMEKINHVWVVFWGVQTGKALFC